MNTQAYYYRGLAKFNSKNKIGACTDWQKALDLGIEDAQSSIDEKCN